MANKKIKTELEEQLLVRAFIRKNLKNSKDFSDFSYNNNQLTLFEYIMNKFINDDSKTIHEKIMILKGDTFRHKISRPNKCLHFLSIILPMFFMVMLLFSVPIVAWCYHFWIQIGPSLFSFLFALLS